jgi:hypothetical protein
VVTNENLNSINGSMKKKQMLQNMGGVEKQSQSSAGLKRLNAKVRWSALGRLITYNLVYEIKPSY